MRGTQRRVQLSLRGLRKATRSREPVAGRLGDPDRPNVAGRQIVADLEKAVFSGDLTFGQGVVSAIYKGRHIATREDGLKLASAAVMIELTYVENLAAP